VLASSEGVAFLPSTDLDRAEAFFQGRLDLALVSRSPFACVFRCGGSTLRVTRVDELRPQPFTVFGWAVSDLRASAAQLTARGVELLRYDGLDQDATGVWTTPGGDLVAWFHDPDMNVLSLTELATT
jgi:catechol 2,3-dioxygenase-like lactoylglutathione lyase family enzyme